MKGKLLAAAIAISCGIAMVTIRTCTNREKIGTEEATALQIRKQIESKPIAFAGLSGTPPRFIEEGPDRGNGWAEYETLEVRKGMKEDGFPLQVEWMSSARIEHEIRSGAPLCTWPAEWKAPEKVFSQKLDRIYSIPINLKGDEQHSILFRADDEGRFKKHFNSKGDIEIASLVRDASLKTLLVRDRDYGDFSDLVSEVDSEGNQQLKGDFKKNIILLVIRESRQLIEMLNASRFDYVLADSVEEADFVATGVPKNHFRKVNLSSNRISDIRDPRLVLHSIACAIHPLTIRAMPYFNKWISRVRGTGWISRKSVYRSSLEKRETVDLRYRNSLVHTFRGVFESGGADAWFPLQEKQVEGLRMFPPEVAEEDPPIEKRPPKEDPAWLVLQESPRSLLVMRENDRSPEYFPFKHPEALWASFPQNALGRYLNPFELSPPEEKKAKSLNILSSMDLSKLEALTLFAFGQSWEDLAPITPFLKNLTEIKVLGLAGRESAELVKRLPNTLKKITFVSSSLSQSNLPQRLLDFPLVELRLPDSQITHDQLSQLIRNIPTSIRSLDLSYHRASFDRKNATLFKSVHWPNLEELSLENSVLFDEHLAGISSLVSSQLKTLNLGLNFFSPRAIARLISRPLPQLETLDLSSSILLGFPHRPLLLPPNLKHLHLSNCQLRDENLGQLSFPKQLVSLDLSSNPIGKNGVPVVLSHLAKEVTLLNLSNTHLDSQAIELLAAAPIDKIERLLLANNGLAEKEIAQLSRPSFILRHLDLSSNRIHNAGAGLIARHLLLKLKSIDLSRNPISETGVRELAEKIPVFLESLSLGSLISLDVPALAKALPKHLKRLDLSNNQISTDEVFTLATHLPMSLESLNLAGSAFSEIGAEALAKHLPETLLTLDLIDTPLSSQGLRAIAKGLPRNLNELSLSASHLTPNALHELARALPRRLKSLSLRQFLCSKGGDLAPLLQALPESVLDLFVRATPLGDQGPATLARHFPRNLRRMHFSGVPLGDRAVSLLANALPQSLEEITLLAAGLGDPGVQALAKQALPNVHNVQWGQNPFSGAGFRQFLTGGRHFWLLILNGNFNLKDDLLLSLSAHELSSIRHLSLMNSPLSHPGWVKLLPKLNQDLNFLDMTSSRIQAERVSEIIKKLPTQIRWLSVRGTEIGEKGRRAFQERAEAQFQETEVPLHLDE